MASRAGKAALPFSLSDTMLPSPASSYDVFLTFLFHLPDFCPINLVQFIQVAVSVLRLITFLLFSLETETNKRGL